MNGSLEKAQVAWQPLTAGGVAAFARASWGRLLVVQFVIALLVAAAVVWFLHGAWFPTISEAVRQLPERGEIRSGILIWERESPMELAEGRFLALVVDLNHTGEARSPAQVQVEFGRTDFKVYSLFGYLRGSYPRHGAVAFNRTELVPWWGAWAPAILGIVACGVVAGLLASWACLATVYSLPVWLLGFFANRECNLGGSWRLAGAAQMPGALFMCAAIVWYGWGAMDLVGLALAGAAHFVISWIYLFVSPLRLPRHPAVAVKENPFG